MIKATFGTGGFLMLNTGSKPVMSQHRLLTTIAYQIQGKTSYGLEGSLYQAGSIVKWLRDELKLFSLASDTEMLANSIDSNEGVYLVPSFNGLGAPHWVSTSGAVIMGLSRTSGRAHIARAALESVCYQTRDVLLCMREDSGQPLLLCRVDGGMAANSWFLQFLASLCNIKVQCPLDVETTALGAAMLAAIGAGESSLRAVSDDWSYEKEYIPGINNKEMDKNYHGWQQALRMVMVG
jgi:glycerol kinase